MAVSLSPIGGAASQFFNSNGVPLSGGKMYTYEAGTTTPKATYTEANGLTAHSNPIILDSTGRVPGGEIWLTSGQAYLFILKSSNDTLIGTWDNIYGYAAGTADAVTEVQVATVGQTDFVLTSMIYTPGTNTLGVYIDGVNQVVNNAYTEVSATTVTFASGLHAGAVVKFIQINSAATSADLVTYTPAGTSAVTATVQAKLREIVSVLDFGASPSATGAANTLAFKDAFDAAIAANSALYIPAGEYNIATSIAPTYVPYTADPMVRNHSILLYGDGYASTILNFTGTGYCFDYTANIASAYTDYIHIKGIQIATTTGGGISMPASGGVVVDDFFMNGCATTYWGLLMQGSYSGGVGIYNIKVDGCRFWNNGTNYQGGAIYCENFICFNLSNTFISQQYKDGDICFFSNGRVLNIGAGVMIEGVNAATTAQVGIAIGGNGVSDSIFSTNIESIYFEGRLDTCIRLGATRQFNVSVKNLFANFYAGKATPAIFDAATATNHVNLSLNGVTYFSAETSSAGAATIIGDYFNLVSLSNAFNASSGAQSSRDWINGGKPNVSFGDKTTGIVKVTSAAEIPSLSSYKWSGVGENYYSTRTTLDTLGNLKFQLASEAQDMGSEVVIDILGIDRATMAVKFERSLNESWGTNPALLGSNCPAADPSMPYTWIRVLTSDGSSVHIPAWK